MCVLSSHIIVNRLSLHHYRQNRGLRKQGYYIFYLLYKRFN